MHIVPAVVGRHYPVPILAKAVRAGFPSPADDHLDRGIDLNEILIRNKAATILGRIDGDSMLTKGLHDGDLAVVDRSLEPENGDVVVVDVDGERSFKVWHVVGRRVRLAFANPRFPAFETPSSAEILMWGVVSGSVSSRRRSRR